MSIRSIVERSRAWGRDQIGTLTHGQRWTSALALGLAVVMLVAGMPSNVRVIATPPRIVVPPPTIVVDVPPPPLQPFVPSAPFVSPSVAPPPVAPPPRGDDGPTPPPVTPASCSFDEGLPAPITMTAVEQLTAAQAAYEEATGTPLGVDLASVVAFAGGCTDALPEAEALITVAEALTQIYEALEASGVPPIDLPEPPVVSLPEIPAPLQPILRALAPITLPLCGGVSTALALAPVAASLLPFPSTEILPYLWPVRALCGLLVAYAPAPEAAAVPAAGKFNGR